MGLIGILITIVIIIFAMVFWGGLSPFASKSSPQNPQNIEKKAQDAVDSFNKKSNLEKPQNITP